MPEPGGVTAVWRSWTSRSASTSVTVTNGPVTQLAFTTQPSNSTGGVAFPTQPVVTARDANGNTVTDYSGTVTLTPRGGSASGVLSGCTATLTNGVTSFSGCKIDRFSGTSYFLRATDGTRTVDSSTFRVNTGPLAQFLFTTQPGNGTGGNQLSTQPVLTATDAGGNTVTTYSGTPTLSIVPGTGTAGAVLSECDIDDNDNGVIVFDNCEIDRAGTGYRLRARDGTATGDSSAFNVTVGSVDDIVFTTEPGGGATGGLAFPTQPVVTAVDDGGNTVTTYSSTVGLAIASGPSGATLRDCVGTRVNGVTTFSGCSLDRAGTYVLRADDGPRDDQSASFTVAVGPLAKLAFTAQPSTATAGVALSTSPRVTGADAGGNLVAGYSGTIALSVERDPTALSGCTPSVSSGVTTFSGCRLTRAGSGWVLHASDGTVEGDSSSITVSAGSATQLAFTTQPAGATAAAAFTTQPVVTAQDAFGNTATSYGGTVTLAIKSGTGTAGAALSSCSGSRVNGVTTFSNCRIDRVGTGYQLRATGTSGVGSVDSAAFAVTVGPAARLALSATTRPTAGVATDLTITALDAGGNVATSYAGARSLVFSGADRSPSDSSPTVANSSATAIAFGSATALTFTDGVARTTMVLRDAEADSIRVDDGPLDNSADLLDVVVQPDAARNLAWTSSSTSRGTLSSICLFTCTVTNSASNATFTGRVSVTDVDGNVVSDLGSNLTVTLATPTSGTGSGGSFTSPSSGRSITITIARSGTATSGTFTFQNTSSGSWTTHTFSATGGSFTAASATVNN